MFFVSRRLTESLLAKKWLFDQKRLLGMEMPLAEKQYSQVVALLLFSARESDGVWWPHGGFLFHLLYYYIERSWTFGRREQCIQLIIHFDIFFREIKTYLES